MKLIHITTLRVAAIAALVLAFWAALFYVVIIDEINDETDDALENYAENIIRRKLAGETLPSSSSGSNNQYFLRPVSDAYAARTPHVRYADREVFIAEKNEYEPARVLTYIFCTEDGRYHEVEVSTPTIEKEDLRESILILMVVLYGAIFVSVVSINAWTIYRSLRPMRRLLRWLDDYDLGKHVRRLHIPTRITELKRLNEVVASAIERNEQTFERQRQFISNASHEIQTPLAISLNRIEMLLDDGQLGERQMGEIIKIRHTLDRLSRLNKSLLMLSRIDNGQFDRREDIDVGRLICDTLPDLEDAYAAKKIEVSVTTASPFCVVMSRPLAELLVGNLLKNAFVHNVDGGRVVIHIAADSVCVANTGESVPLNADKIFARFYHTTGMAGSTGLGLALVKSVCEQSSLHIAYRHEETMHVFMVKKNKNQNFSVSISD